MSLLTEPLERPPVERAWRRHTSIWKNIRTPWFTGAMLGFGSFLLAFLLHVKESSQRNWSESVTRFSMYVLVQGDQLGIDEVGRFLNGLNGVEKVALLRPEQVFDQYPEFQILPDDLENLGRTSLPPIWRVHWQASFFNQDKLLDSAQEIRSFPGVVDVAYDKKLLEEARQNKLALLKSRLVFSFLLFLFLTTASVVVGRLFFIKNLRSHIKARYFIDLGLYMLFSLVGFVLCFQLVGYPNANTYFYLPLICVVLLAHRIGSSR